MTVSSPASTHTIMYRKNSSFLYIHPPMHRCICKGPSSADSFPHERTCNPNQVGRSRSRWLHERPMSREPPPAATMTPLAAEDVLATKGPLPTMIIVMKTTRQWDPLPLFNGGNGESTARRWFWWRPTASTHHCWRRPPCPMMTLNPSAENNTDHLASPVIQRPRPHGSQHHRQRRQWQQWPRQRPSTQI